MKQATKHITALKWVALLIVTALATVTTIWVAQKRTPAPTGATIYVMPHPDDEFQFWSILERHPDDYTILVSLTRGEETRYCEPENLHEALQEDLGEVPPIPTPTGKWTAECEKARINSLLGFLESMGNVDSGVPSTFDAPKTVVPAPEPADETICRVDDDMTECTQAQREAKIWLDTEGRGAVVFFNLGDGDLEVHEVAWALNSLLKNQETWFDATRPVRSIVGSFASTPEAPCYSYPHPDHLAIHEALWNIDFGAGPQLAATCFLDPRQTLTARVSPSSANAAFSLGASGERLGAHEIYYGWLHTDTYPLAHVRQSSLFHRVQSFWVRFA